jgi:hypothetical protein
LFKIVENPEFTHEVEAQVPVDGGHERQSMRVTYRVIPVEEADAADLGGREGTDALLDRIVVRIDDLVDPDGKPVEWNDRVRAQVLRLPYARLALVRGYYDGVSGARRKN